MSDKSKMQQDIDDIKRHEKFCDYEFDVYQNEHGEGIRHDLEQLGFDIAEKDLKLKQYESKIELMDKMIEDSKQREKFFILISCALAIMLFVGFFGAK